MTTVEVLKAARARIKKGWCQGAQSRDANGCVVDASDPGAVAWCARGAIWAFDSNDSVACPFLYDACDEMSVVDWNDHPNRKKEEVLALFDRAIALAEKAVQP